MSDPRRFLVKKASNSGCSMLTTWRLFGPLFSVRFTIPDDSVAAVRVGWELRTETA